MGNAIKNNLLGKVVTLSREQYEQLQEIIAELLAAWENTEPLMSQYQQQQLVIDIEYLKRMQNGKTNKQTDPDNSIDIFATTVKNFIESFDTISIIVNDGTAKYNEDWPGIRTKLMQYLEKVKEE